MRSPWAASATTPHSFLNNVHSADTSNIYRVLFAGRNFQSRESCCWSPGSTWSASPPLSRWRSASRSSSGTVLSYILQPKRQRENDWRRACVCAVVAVILDGKAYGELSGNKAVSRKSTHHLRRLRYSDEYLGAILHARHDARQHARSLQRQRLSLPRRAAFLLHLEFLFHEASAGGRARRIQRILPRPGARPCAGIHRRRDLVHGTVFDLVASTQTGVAISYSIGQSAPMVAALWGIFAWKEFAGANKSAKPISR